VAALAGRLCRTGLIALASLLAGCASGRIWTDESAPQGIALHWYTKEVSIDAAKAAADAHCRQAGRRAVLVREFEDQDITRAQFDCR
jgi:hypothetical protein